MNNIIKIHKSEDLKQTVNARDLYQFLEVGRDFSTWIKNRIKKYDFEENVDYTMTKSIPQNGGVVKTYFLSIDMAKELSMVANNSKGKDARQYFIKCERELKEVTAQQIPTNFSEALKLAYDQSLVIEEQTKQIEQDKPKVDFFDSVADSKDAIEIGDVARVMNIGVGRNTLFRWMRQDGMLMQNNQPYQSFIDRGYFRTIESKYTLPTGETKVSIKTLVYQKGVNYLLKKYSNN